VTRLPDRDWQGSYRDTGLPPFAAVDNQDHVTSSLVESILSISNDAAAPGCKCTQQAALLARAPLARHDAEAPSGVVSRVYTRAHPAGAVEGIAYGMKHHQLGQSHFTGLGSQLASTQLLEPGNAGSCKTGHTC
jgi:hypothetical protein